ncbi:MAG TPA: adenylate/guanylate cyclase domain-containing protein, partial [Actinomycetes bacterium]|nr:adenylate/guanylate cyclase domain-containing protein [Actinomycetes bacterium]
NPLFVEEMFAMLVDDGLLARTNGSWAPSADLSSVPVPPTIAALLAARLDRLSTEERFVLECASVVGQVFWRTSVAELATGGPGTDVARHLLGLVRHELIRPDRSSFAGDDAFRFRHLLIRDATYSALPKADRADLHEAFTVWLERVAGQRVGEYEAILGYHLEQACRLRAELGPASEADTERARRGAAWLARAGRRSLDQGDDRSAAGLLDRAANLLPSDGDVGRAELLVDLGRALLGVGELARVEAVLSEAVDATPAAEDRCLHGRALLERMLSRMNTGPWMGPAEELTAAWIPVFTEHGDHRGLALAHWLLGWVWVNSGRNQHGQRSFELAWRHARQAGNTRLALDCLGSLRLAINIGPTPASESLRLFRDYAHEVANRYHQARLEEAEACVLAMQGAVAESRALLASSRATYKELGLELGDAYSAQSVYEVEMTAGDAGGATEDLLTAAQTLEAVGDITGLATTAGMLAEALVAQGRDGEAEAFSRTGEDLADTDDVDAQMRWRRARARVLARHGDMEAAERLAREALALVADTDALNDHANTLLDLAEILRLADRPEEATAA